MRRGIPLPQVGVWGAETETRPYLGGSATLRAVVAWGGPCACQAVPTRTLMPASGLQPVLRATPPLLYKEGVLPARRREGGQQVSE